MQRAIPSFTGANRVGMMASGGLSHFVIDEELDHTVLSAMEHCDEEALARVPENVFRARTADSRTGCPSLRP